MSLDIPTLPPDTSMGHVLDSSGSSSLLRNRTSRLNGTRILTPWRQLNSDPFSLLIFGQSSLVVAAGTRPRSRSLSR